MDNVKPKTEAVNRVEHLQPPKEPNKLKIEKAAQRTEPETKAIIKPKMMPPFFTREGSAVQQAVRADGQTQHGPNCGKHHQRQ